MTKEQILGEIKRTAEANGGVAFGQTRFERETGMKPSDWRGKYWARWGDALIEAGYSPNLWTPPYDEKLLLARYIELARELGRLPVKSELDLRKRTDPTFPSSGAFRRLASKDQLVGRIVRYCQSAGGHDDILRMCNDYVPQRRGTADKNEFPGEDTGFVYLIKSGRYYKIGRSNASGRREYEIGLQLPEKATLVHEIRTDDPVGIEAYWHKRFATKRKHGEWFELSGADISAFRRRKFM